MQNNNKALQATLLLASTLTVMAGATIAPSLPQMARVFSNTPNAEFLSKLILTIPALFIAVCSPFAGRIIDRLGRLRLLFMALIIYAIGGVSGYFLNNLYHILVGRALLGIAVAGIMTVAVTLIGDYFEGRTRERFMGIQAASMSFGGMIFVGTGGFLADISWRSPFLIYGFSIIVLLLASRYLYEPDRETATPSLLPDKLPPILLLVYAVAFVGMILFYMLPVQIPFLLNEIGVTKNALAGLAIVVATLGSTISSLSYHRLKNRFSFATILAVLFFLMAIGFLVISSAQQYSTVIIGMIISGFGLGLMMPNLNIWLLTVTPPKIRGTAVGILTMSLFLGQFFSPIAVAPLEQVYSLSGVFFLGGGFMVVISLFFMVFHFYRSRR